MLSSRLPEEIEAKAVKRIFYATEIVPQDGGGEVRTARWANAKAEWDVAVPPMFRTEADYLATIALFHEALGSADTFPFCDPETGDDVAARFKDDAITISGQGSLASIEFTLIEVKGEALPS